MRRRLTQEEFLNKCKAVHGSKFDYSKTEYTGSQNKIIIICQIHGEFEQKANDHTNGKGCLLCAQNKFNQHEIIKTLEDLHPNLDFSKVVYKNTKEKVQVSCKICNHEFTPTIGNLKNLKSGCPKCANNILKSTTKFITECKELFLDRFDYTNTNYTGSHDIISIHCNKHDIDFEIPAYQHLSCRGCDICSTENNSSKAVMNIESRLKSLEIDFIREKRFENCKNILPLSFDFYIPDLNLCIEYDGAQHFIPLKHWGGEESLKNRKINDEIKNQYCKDNNINLLRLKYNEPYIKKLLEYLDKNK